MALISCPECGRQVSDAAEKCPNCGYPIYKIGYGGKSIPSENSSPPPKELKQITPKEKREQRKKQRYEEKSVVREYVENTEKPPLIGRTWFLIVMFLLIPPVGAILLWITKRPKNIVLRVILTIVALLCLLAMFGGHKNEAPVSNSKTDTVQVEKTADKDQIETDGAEEDVASKPVLESISASYSGDTEAGTVLDDNNRGFTVTAYYDDGSSEEVTTGWTIKTAKTLEASQSTKVRIEYEGYEDVVKVDCSTIDPETYKAECEDISYDELARNPDNYMFRKIHVYGQILQVQENDNTVQMRVATKDSGYGNWYDDVVLVEYEYKPDESKLLEEDFINLYGTYYGTYSYTAVLGNTITVPSVVAEVVERQ